MIATIATSEMFVSAKKSFALLITPPAWYTGLAAVLGALVLSMPKSYQLLLIVMGCSMASGALVALKKRQACPWDGFWSVIRRLAEFGLLWITHEVFEGMGNHFGVPLEVPITTTVALLFTGVEYIAFTEDCKALGVWVPQIITSRMKRILEKIEAAGDVTLETQTTTLSPAGVVTGIQQSVTTLRQDPPKDAPLVIPSSDVH